MIVLLAIGFGLAKLVALPFGGVGTFGALLLGLLIVAAILGGADAARTAQAGESRRGTSRRPVARATGP